MTARKDGRKAPAPAEGTRRERRGRRGGGLRRYDRESAIAEKQIRAAFPRMTKREGEIARCAARCGAAAGYREALAMTRDAIALAREMHSGIDLAIRELEALPGLVIGKAHKRVIRTLGETMLKQVKTMLESSNLLQALDRITREDLRRELLAARFALEADGTGEESEAAEVKV